MSCRPEPPRDPAGPFVGVHDGVRPVDHVERRVEAAPPKSRAACYELGMRGEVYWVAAQALRPGVAGVDHPQVVVSDDLFNHSRIPTVVVCGVTSRTSRRGEPGTVALEAGEGGLPQPSVVLASQVSVVDKADLGERLGRLTDTRVDQILAALRFVQRLSTRG